MAQQSKYHLCFLRFFLLSSSGHGIHRRTKFRRAANAKAPPAADTAPLFEHMRILPGANPPAACTAAIYGTITARAPDGALCLCHQSYDGKHGFWEQLGTGKACWPDKK